MGQTACALAGASWCRLRDCNRRSGVRHGNRVVNGADAGWGPGQWSAENPGPTDLRDEENKAETDAADDAEQGYRGAAHAQQHAPLGQPEAAQRAR